MSTQPEPAPAARPAKNAAVPVSITHEEFVTATNHWQSILDRELGAREEGLVDLTHYFQVPAKAHDETKAKLSLIAGYEFPLDSIEKLVSTVGMHTVMARFGIVQDPDTQQDVFTVILYGFNSFKMRVTPYLVGKCFTVPYATAALEDATAALEEKNPDQVPDVLGSQWIEYWQSYAKEHKKHAVRIGPPLFKTIYGFLQGYNYGYDDFVDTLFPVSAGSAPASLHLRVNFGLHRYFQVDATAPEDVVNTFGLVLCLSEVKAGPAGQRAVVSSSRPYYDFSAPCPPTC